MAEIKNTFIKSKMNKDLDDRLLSNGEYRNAQNVNISRSEGEDVGSLENVLGNKIASSLMASVAQELLGEGVVVIGFLEDDTNKCVYTFLTNYTDPFLGQQTQAPYSSQHYIVKTELKNITDPSYENSQILVRGSFLNFSQTDPIYGVNLIEDLLFWTDNRNQPRKINVKLAVSVLDTGPFEQPKPGAYYTSEDQISVAKYYPLHAPKIFDQVSVNIKTGFGADPVTGDVKNFVTTADAKKVKGGMMMLRGSDSLPAYPGSGLERFIIAVFVGTDATSYFLTNKNTIGPTETNKIVDFGYCTAVKATGEFMDYSITGSVFRENSDLAVTQGPLKQQTFTGIPGYGSGNAKFTQGWFGATFAPGDYIAAGYDLYSGNGFTNANVNLKFIQGVPTGTGSENGMRVTELTVTMGGSSGGNGFEVGSVIRFTAATIGVASSGFLQWTLDADDLAKIESPTATTFYWSGSSIPYTKMKVDVPGYESSAPYPQSNTITKSEFVGKFVLSATSSTNYYKITTQYDHNIGSSTDLNAVAIAEFSWPNPDYLRPIPPKTVGVFPGDPEYLKNRFVRFAYRFKFDDGEYSLISPFTQPVFVPKQRGFIQDGVSLVSVNDTTPPTSATGNVTSSPFQRYATGEEDIQASTIVSFFENNIDTVVLRIETPYPVSGLDVTMKITEIDIIYKESDASDMKVLDTIPYEVFKYTDAEQTTLNNTNVFKYLYESKEPFKLVKPTEELTRVYDKVPVKAFAQETSGGRIIYGNFLDKHTPPSSLKFNVRVTQKTAPVTKNITTPRVDQDGVVGSSSYLSYPTHTLKQNRTYQIGFVLSDRYGRQSDVILAPVDTGQYYVDTIKYDGGTIFNPYFQNSGYAEENIATWRGENLEILLREAIPETVTYADGYPGLYNSGEYVMNVASSQADPTITFTSIDTRIKVGDIFTQISNNVPFYLKSVVIAIDLSLNQITFNNSVTVTPNATTGDVLINNTGIINGDPNVLGWYSYKVVVKQLTDDYYNAYLGNLAYISPDAALSSNFGNYPFSGSSFVTSLLSDNSSKIAADLTKVAPEQLQFGTSDTLLYPRVGGTQLKDSAFDYIYAVNFAFGTETASINAYGKIKDLGVAELNSAGTAFKTPTQSRGVQAAVSDPTSILLSMPNGQQIGREYWRPSGLYVLEVGALESKIEIFWETSTSGLISDLNASFLEGPIPSRQLPAANPNPNPPTDGNVPVD